MAGQILVALNRHDRIQEILPYIEEIAKPGMRIVFLIPYPVELWLYLRDHWVTTESPTKAMLEGRKIMERYSWELQRGLAEQRVFPAREALRKRGVEIAVDIYTGSLRKVVESYTHDGDVHVIMMRAGIGLRIMGFLHGISPLFRLFKRPSFSSVLLLHPDNVKVMNAVHT